jgi:histidinol dehydrogenase
MNGEKMNVEKMNGEKFNGELIIPPALEGGAVDGGALRTREWAENAGAERVAAKIISEVRARGDAALREYTKEFDHVDVGSFVVPEDEISDAVASVEQPLREAMARAARNIRAYHEKQVRHGFIMSGGDGVTLGQRVLPIDHVAIYVPGGTAAYPSTLLMNAIPAKIAGVRRLALATPPQRDGKCAPQILAAAAEAGVDCIYKVGGAQAIAALAFGTESIPKFDKIVGPGNVYVSAAKRLVYGVVDIDMIAGPSEILVIADDSADARGVAADMLSQAEHDALAACILITTSSAFAQAVRAELASQLPALPRREIAGRSLAANGRIAVVQSLAEAAKLSNAVAPEHLELCVRDPFALMGEITHAGSVFLGHNTPEAVGDYYAGPNNTLPTNGAARFASPLSVDDFVKKSSFAYYTKSALRRDCADIACFARAEGFEAHARSVESRFWQQT